ncbi:MAG: c-type cytochrome [Casimicrobiaceae bacterium]
MPSSPLKSELYFQRSLYRHLVAAFTVMCSTLGIVACAYLPKEEAPIASLQPPPPWAYMIQPQVQLPPDDGILKRVPDSAVTLTLTQIRDLYVAPDWHSGDHPLMPEAVARGRKPDTFACGYCHYPDGQGRPENSSLAGLSAGYITQQIDNYKSGLRKSAEPGRTAANFMIASAKSATEAEVKVSAAYFAGLKYRPWVKVVETATIPKTHVEGFMLVADGEAATEPIGQRVIEVADDVKRTALRDSRSGFIAYVPVGSIKRGEALVTTGGRGKTTACATCHGQDLRGVGDVPPLAGRSPTYTVRQLYDFQSGARTGSSTAPMKESVAKLTIEDMVAIAAYTASRIP